MRIHRIISFIVDREKDRPDGKLRMRVRWGKDSRVAVNVGYRVTLDKWSMESQRCKANTTHGPKKCTASEINAEIQRYEHAADLAFGPFEAEGREPSEDEYRAALRVSLGRSVEPASRPLQGLFCEYLSLRSVERSWSELSLETIRNTLFGILKEYPRLSLSEMATERWLSLWVSDMVRQDKLNTTIKTRLTIVKMFMNWADRKGYAKADEVKNYSPRIKVVPHTVVWLEWDELMQFFNAKIEPDSRRHHDELARDMFCLSSFTSLRISDIRNLKWSDIDDAGIHRVLQKTSVPITIDFNRYSRAIIERWRGRTYPGIHVFGEDIPYNSVLIDCVRRLAKRLGFDRPVTETYFVGSERKEKTEPLHDRLTMHCGRKTFICNALEMGIQPQVVMQWTGHADYKSMKPYMAVSDKAKASAMRNFDK